MSQAWLAIAAWATRALSTGTMARACATEIGSSANIFASAAIATLSSALARIIIPRGDSTPGRLRKKSPDAIDRSTTGTGP